MKKVFSTFFVVFGLMFTTISAQPAMRNNVARECVLFECFTGVNCGFCPGNAAAIGQMLAEDLAIAPIAYHAGNFATPPYITQESTARMNYYNVTAFPTTQIDGSITQTGGAQYPGNTYNTLLPYYTQRIAAPSPFTIDLTYTQITGTSYQATVTVHQDGTCTATNLKVMIVLTQSNIPQNWGGGMTSLNCVCRDMLPDQLGTPYNGGDATIVENFDLGTYPREDCHLVAFIQDYSTKEVFQAVRLTLNQPDYDYNLYLMSINHIEKTTCTGKLKPQVVVKNVGAVEVTSFDLVAKMNGTEVARQTKNIDAISFSQKVTLEFDEFEFTSSDQMQLAISVENPNGQPDMFLSDNTLSTSIEPAPESNEYVLLRYKTDNNPEETTIQLINTLTNEVLTTLNYTVPNSTFIEFLYLDYIACYRLVITDSGNDGISTFFNLTSNENTMIFDGSASVHPFTDQISVEFFSTQGQIMVNPPTNLQAVADGMTIDLSWDAPILGTSPDSYNIYKDDVLLTNVTTTNYSDVVSDFGIYCYTVTAVSNTNESEPTEEDCAEIAALYAPTDVAATAVNENVTIIWTAPSTGTTPSSYNIYRNDVLLANVTTTSYSDVLSDFGVYCYDVTSIAAVEESSHSTESCVEWSDLYAPGDVTAAANNLNIDLTWNAPTAGYTPESYNIYRDGVLLDNTTTTSFSDVIMVSGSYCYVVTSVKGNDESENSDEACAEITVLFAPTNVVAVSVETSVTLSWTAPENGYAPESYNIYRDEELISNVESTEFNDDNLEDGIYCYKVASVVEDEESALSNQACTEVNVTIREFSEVHISVYPNPSNGVLNIATDICGSYPLSVYNLLGQKVYENTHFVDGSLNLSCEKGVYLIKISTEKETIMQKVVLE